MLIGINGNEANVEHKVGVGQYAFELLCGLHKLASSDRKFKIYLAAEPREEMPKENEYWKYKILSGGKLWTLTKLQKELIVEKIKGNAPDIFLTLTHYAPLFMPVPSVVCIMDLAFERFPQYFKKSDLYQLKYWTRISVVFAQKIITISEFSKNEIHDLYGISKNKVSVVYPGYDKERFNEKTSSLNSRKKEVIRKKYDLDGGYFAYIGTLQPRKNLVRLIEAFANLTRKNLKLVIVGMKNEGRGGWMFDQFFNRVRELEIQDRVVFTGYVPNDDLPPLLSESLAYVLPSLYEGFGIPPVEAMALGVPVVVSRVSSLPEVCGDEAIYIDDPYDSKSIQKALESVLSMKANELVPRMQRGKRWVEKYDCDKSACKLLGEIC